MSKAATTRRIRRRAAQYRGFKAEVLARQWSLDAAIADALIRGKTQDDVRARLVEQLGECWRNLASRKREVRQLPHMRGYHSRYALGEMALIRLGQKMLAELDANA